MNAKSNKANPKPKRSCLTIDDLYRYVAVPSGEHNLPDLDAHLAECSHCREELSEILYLLHPEDPEDREPLPEISEEEISRTISLIQDVARKEKQHTRRVRWAQWAAAAAAAVLFVGAGAGGYWYSQFRTSNQRYDLAKSQLEEFYAPESKNGLRLDLPFRPSGTTRAPADDSALENARDLFSLVKDNRRTWAEPRLGLAAIYLHKAQFAQARAEFQAVLDFDGSDVRALIGRGVTSFEESNLAEDPIHRRASLGSALADFEAALRHEPDSAEARYNLIWALFEAGRHQEAQAEIEKYLSRDPDSIWAARLKELRIRLTATTADGVMSEVDRLAPLRDAAPLRTIARLAPEQASIAIRGVLRKSLKAEAAPPPAGKPGAEDLRWAAETLEDAYSEATGDKTWQSLFRFYDGLSPPQRELKRSLDHDLDRRADLLRTNQAGAAFRGSETLQHRFSLLQDHWQVFNTHFLRGNCCYYLADFERAEAEYLEMLRCAERIGPPELKARALAALLSVLAQLNRLDQVEARATELHVLAEEHRLSTWKVTADIASGSLARKRNRLDESLTFFTRALGLAYRDFNLPALDPLLQGIFTLMVQLDRPEDAQSVYDEALNVLITHQDAAGFGGQAELDLNRLGLLWRHGAAALELGHPELAASSFRRGLEKRFDQMRDLECMLRLGLAEALLGMKRFVEAGAELERASSLAASGNFEALAWQAGLLRGIMNRRMGDTESAYSEFHCAIEALERRRQGTNAIDFRSQFGFRRLDPYREVVSLMAQSANGAAEAAGFVDRAKSMVLSADYSTAPKRAASTTANEEPIRGTIFVDYYFAADELLAFISARDNPRVVRLGASRAGVAREVRQFLRSIAAGTAQEFDGLSRRLHDELVEPVLKAAGHSDLTALVIFPDGPLYSLPFAGLQDAGGLYLLEKYALSYAPSRSVLLQCMAQGGAGSVSGSRSVRLLDGTANLVGAGSELTKIAKLYGENAVLLSARDKAAFAEHAADSEILHFSGHASMENGSPVLELTPRPNPVTLDSREISSWRLRRNGLVTLAGCETGVGPTEEGYAPWGLVPAFLKAGAPALIVSLLRVDDAATVQLTDRFYELLVGGSVSKAAALQQAQLALLASSRAAGRPNPALWLPYVLVGDPR